MKRFLRWWKKKLEYLGLNGCRVDDFMNDPITEHYGAYDCVDLIKCSCPSCRSLR